MKPLNSLLTGLSLFTLSAGFVSAQAVPDFSADLASRKATMEPQFPNPIMKIQSLAYYQPATKETAYWVKQLDAYRVSLDGDDYVYDTDVAAPFMLGVLLADGFFAIQAKDTERLSSISDAIEILALKLGATEQDIAKTKIMNNYAIKGEWVRVTMELNYLRYYVMNRLKTADNTSLVYMGAWMQGANYMMNVVKSIQSDGNAAGISGILREPDLVSFLIRDVKQEPAKAGHPVISEGLSLLEEIYTAVNVPLKTPVPAESVAKYAEALTEYVNKAVTTLEKK